MGGQTLAGRAIKAANNRTAAKFFQSLCLKYLNSGREEHLLLRAVAKHLVDFYDILYCARMFLTDAEKMSFRRACLD